MNDIKIRSLKNDEASMLIGLLNMPYPKVVDLYGEMMDQDGAWVLKALEKRSEAYNIKLTKDLLVFILFISDGRIGYGVKYIDHVYKYCSIHFYTDTVSLKKFGLDILPNGVFDFN